MFLALTAAILAAAPVTKEVPATTPTDAQPVARGASNPRVCIVDQVTGSRLPRRTCRLLSEWRADGIDPLAKP
ncbi:MAG: hypothetical protein PGN08_10500 [Sphingomonas taxi]